MRLSRSRLLGRGGLLLESRCPGIASCAMVGGSWNSPIVSRVVLSGGCCCRGAAAAAGVWNDVCIAVCRSLHCTFCREAVPARDVVGATRSAESSLGLRETASTRVAWSTTALRVFDGKAGALVGTMYMVMYIPGTGGVGEHLRARVRDGLRSFFPIGRS